EPHVGREQLGLARSRRRQETVDLFQHFFRLLLARRILVVGGLSGEVDESAVFDGAGQHGTGLMALDAHGGSPGFTMRNGGADAPQRKASKSGAPQSIAPEPPRLKRPFVAAGPLRMTEYRRDAEQ